MFISAPTGMNPKRHFESSGNCGTVLASFSATGFVAPQTDPANAGVRGEFLLGIFPPDHGGNHALPTPTAPPAK
jgi:hypothetical protein